MADYALARARLERALVLGRDLRQPWTIAYALTNLGGVLNTQGYTQAQSTAAFPALGPSRLSAAERRRFQGENPNHALDVGPLPTD